MPELPYLVIGLLAGIYLGRVWEAVAQRQERRTLSLFMDREREKLTAAYRDSITAHLSEKASAQDQVTHLQRMLAEALQPGLSHRAEPYKPAASDTPEEESPVAVPEEGGVVC